MDRRIFLKKLFAIGAGSAALPAIAGSAEATQSSGIKEFVSVLVDTTRCIGCRSCEVACVEANDLPAIENTSPTVFDQTRDMTTDQWTVVNRFETDKGEVFVKKQCMHCNQAACSTACLTQAMYKTHSGPVIWREDKCMGCRFCMVSCPFVVPKFEYYSANPKIQKCILCSERLKEDKLPACVEACPVDALQFGVRREMVRVAQNRIVSNPNRYLDHIYGKNEVGGTGWLYISSVPFDQLGFRTDLGYESVPHLTQEFLYAVPVVFLLWPALLNGIRHIKDSDDEVVVQNGEDSVQIGTDIKEGEES
jgi:formate dehydrogenase iron-sulfur subunit